MKTCYICKQTKPLSDFYRDNSRRDGVMSRCKQCDAARHKNYRQTAKGRKVIRLAVSRWQTRNPGYVKRQNIRKKGKLKEFRDKLKRPGCSLCHYDRCLAALDFHHLDGNDKERAMSQCRTKTQMIKEAERCVLVCNRCHAEIHAGLHPDISCLPKAYVKKDKQLRLFRS